jgi:hypothetical protein
MRTHTGPRRPRPRPMPAALLGLAAILVSIHTVPVRAQTDALRAADPAQDAPVAPGPRLPEPTAAGPLPASERSAALAVWQQANARVAEFPRGHIDILRWEAAREPSDPAPAASPALTLGDALVQALRLRPDLVDQPHLSARGRAERRAEMADTVREVQAAWLSAVAARARLSRATDTLENARTGAELGRRMVVAGNWSRMRHLQELQIETAARQSWLAANLAEQVALEHLARRIGLWQTDLVDALRSRLPTDLPAPAAAAPEPPADGVERAVLARRSSLQGDRAWVLRLPSDAGSTAWEAAHARALEQALVGDGPAALPTLTDRRAVNDHRSAHAVQARAVLLAQAAHLRSQAREAWLALNTHHTLARLTQDEALARQQALEEEVLQRYNGMFVSTWELLAAARTRLAALDQVTEARLAYWLAEADWRALLAGGRYAGARNTSMPSAAAAAPKGH